MAPGAICACHAVLYWPSTGFSLFHWAKGWMIEALITYSTVMLSRAQLDEMVGAARSDSQAAY